MRSTGIVRKVDELGRVVLPKELRTSFDIQEKDGLEIFTDGESIVLRKYNPGCALCGGMEGLKDIWDKKVCCKCRDQLKDK